MGARSPTRRSATCPVLIELSVRRLFCDNSDCKRVVFAEQVDGLTSRYGWRTPVLQRIVGALGVVGCASTPASRSSAATARRSSPAGPAQLRPGPGR